MDHLPYPDNPTISHIAIPYLCERIESYDGLDFKSFPARVGWTKENEQSDWYDCDAKTAAGRAQSWLYFGVLKVFLGSKFDIQEFVGNDHAIVSSNRLTRLIDEWIVENSIYSRQSFFVSSLSLSPYRKLLTVFLQKCSSLRFVKSLLERIEPTLADELQECLAEAERQSLVLDSTTPLAGAIVVSIKALLWSLRNAMINCKLTLSQDREDQTLSRNKALKDRMLSAGHCPYWTDVYLKRYSIAMIYYIAALPLNKTRADHRACMKDYCQARNMNESPYKTRHVTEECSCSSTGPNIEEIVRLIENNKTPVLELLEPSPNTMQVKVRQANFTLPYTAISHVWSGGLGNPVVNKLPQCQLRRLKDQLLLCQDKAKSNMNIYNSEGALPKWWFNFRSRHLKIVRLLIQPCLPILFPDPKPMDPMIFWMDTLCVPVSQKYKSLRRKAINKMDFIYSGAENLLVLDPEIRTIIGTNISVLQKRVHILCSSWMTRCWTYQEARLARDWAFSFQDDLYEPLLEYRREREIERNIKLHRVVWNDERELELEAISFVEKLWPITDRRLSNEESWGLAEFVRIWQQLNERSIQKTEDLHLILAILLGLDPREIGALEHKERMKAIFRTQPFLPLSLLYFQHCRSREGRFSGDCWIPEYPLGFISLEFGCLKRTDDCKAYAIQKTPSSCAIFVAQPLSENHGVRIEDPSSTIAGDLSIRFLSENRAQSVESSNSKAVCYFLHDCLAAASSNETERVGARFIVSKFAQDGVYLLKYDCPITYNISDKRCSMNEKPSEDIQWPWAFGHVICSNAMLLLDCNLDSWYNPHFNRMDSLQFPRGQGLDAMPWPQLLWHLILFIWIATLTTAAVEVALDDLPEQASLGRGKRVVLPMTLITFAFVARALIYGVVEMQFIHHMCVERQYHQWASTFASPEGSLSGDVPPKTLTYQYQPWWIAAVIILASCVFIVVGFEVQYFFWARFVGAALAFETTTRLGLEVLWTRNKWLSAGCTRLCFKYFPQVRWSLRKWSPQPKYSRR